MNLRCLFSRLNLKALTPYGFLLPFLIIFFCIWDLPAVVLCLPVVPRVEPGKRHGCDGVRYVLRTITLL